MKIVRIVVRNALIASSHEFGTSDASRPFCLGRHSFEGRRPWDIRVHDARFFRAVLAGGTLGFGESYMDGWWDCEALDEMCCRAIRARLEERVPVNLHTALAFASSFLFNLQTRRRPGSSASGITTWATIFFECMLDPSMQYSCAWFRDTNDLAQAQTREDGLDLPQAWTRERNVTLGHRLWMGWSRQTRR